jgi:hypothetical protein
MELSRTVALTALFFIVVLMLTSGRAFGQNDARAHGKHLAALASEKAELKELEAKEARRAALQRQVRHAWLKKNEVSRRCIIRPVMTDKEIETCRVLYRL